MWSLPDEALGDGLVAGQLSNAFESLELQEAHYHQTDVLVEALDYSWNHEDSLKSVIVPEKFFDTEVIADAFQGLLTPLRYTVCMAAEVGTEMSEAWEELDIDDVNLRLSDHEVVVMAAENMSDTEVVGAADFQSLWLSMKYDVRRVVQGCGDVWMLR